MGDRRVEVLESRQLLSRGGVLDPSFGGGQGSIRSNFGFDGASAGAVAVQPNGQIVVAGSAGNEQTTTKTYGLAVTRLDADGTQDSSFGYFDGDNLNVGDAPASAVAIGPGGVIVIAGANVPPTFGPDPSPGGGLQVVELDSSGKSLGSFGPGGGALDFTFGPGDASSQTVGALAVEPDGSILVGGGYVDTQDTGLAEFAIAKITPSGTLDTAFGTGGVTLVPISTNGAAAGLVTGIAIQPDGKILLVGSAETTDTQGGVRTVVEGDSYVERLDPDGRLDSTFGNAGGTMIRPQLPAPSGPSSYDAFGIGLDASGQILIAGNSSGYLAATRLLADGSVDPTYGISGTSTITGFRSGPLASPTGGVVVRADGQVVVATGLASATDYSPTLPDLQAVGFFGADGTPDGRFGNSGTPGLSTFSTGVAPIEVNALATQADGNLILVGSSGQFSGFEIAASYTVARVTGNVAAPGDYFGTGITPVSVYLASAGALAFRPPTGPDVTIPFGYALPGQSIPALGDYDGAGRAELGVYLPSYGVYAYRPADGSADVTTPFGIPGAGQSIPTPANFSGTGDDDIAVYMPSIAAFGIRPGGTTGSADEIVPIGVPGAGQSLPAPADYFGTGRDDVAVYVASLGAFAIRPGGGGADVVVPFGVAGVGQTIPVPGDYDGSGHVELAVYLPETGQFIYRPYSGGPDITIDVASPGQDLVPAPGDYAGTGYLQFGLFNPATATLTYYQGIAGQATSVDFGTPGSGLSLVSTAAPGAIAGELSASGTAGVAVSARSATVNSTVAVQASTHTPRAARHPVVAKPRATQRVAQVAPKVHSS